MSTMISMAVPGRTLARAPINSSHIPIFLLPAFAQSIIIRGASSSPSSSKQFTTSAARATNIPPRSGEANKKRGESAIRRTGPRTTRGRWSFPLPEPVSRTRTPKVNEYEGASVHGLWGFFNEERKSMIPPEDEASHGRAWTREELGRKSFEDLHRLYWVCIKQKNQVLTRDKERNRLKAGFGSAESEERLKEIKKTMKNIRRVLIERQLAYEDASKMLQESSLEEIFYEDDLKSQRIAQDSSFEDDIDVPDERIEHQPRP